MDFMVIPVAIILLLMGIGYMALSVAGRAATAQVTGVEQMVIVNNDESTRDSRRYKLDYEFAAGGERYTGSVTRIFEGGSHMRQTIPVRYLPFWPHVNAEDGGTRALPAPLCWGWAPCCLCTGSRKNPGCETKANRRLYPVKPMNKTF
jgi:hypothetical protein